MMKKHLLKVLILGDSSVGKTSLMNAFVNRKFSNSYKATIGADFLTKDIYLDDSMVTLQIWDTAGQERFASLGYAFYRGTDCVVYVYDVTNSQSLDNISLWRQQFKSYVGEDRDIPSIIVGNKCDLERLVPERIVKKIAADYKMEYFESSAKNLEGISEPFMKLAKKANDYHKEHPYNIELPETVVVNNKDQKKKCC